MFESRPLHGLPPRGLPPREESGCGLPLALPDAVPVADLETDRRGGIEKTAQKLERIAARGGVTLTHSEAVARVQAARTRGDRIRSEGNR